MSKTTDAMDAFMEAFIVMVASFLTSRTTYIMAIGFIAVYVSSGRTEALQQLLAYLGLSSVWVIKLASQNVAGIIKNGGSHAPRIAEKPKKAPEIPKPSDSSQVRVDTPFFAPLPPVPPPSGPRIDWKEFSIQVDAEKQRLIRECTGEKGGKAETFAKWEAIRNVGGRFIVTVIQDLDIYASMMLDGAFSRFKEAAGFGFHEIEGGRVPEKFAKQCGCNLIVPWAIQNNAYDDWLEVNNAIQRANSINAISDEEWREGWRDRFPEQQRTLWYVYQNIARYPAPPVEPIPIIY